MQHTQCTGANFRLDKTHLHLHTRRLFPLATVPNQWGLRLVPNRAMSKCPNRQLWTLLKSQQMLCIGCRSCSNGMDINWYVHACKQHLRSNLLPCLTHVLSMQGRDLSACIPYCIRYETNGPNQTVLPNENVPGQELLIVCTGCFNSLTGT